MSAPFPLLEPSVSTATPTTTPESTSLKEQLNRLEKGYKLPLWSFLNKVRTTDDNVDGCSLRTYMSMVTEASSAREDHSVSSPGVNKCARGSSGRQSSALSGSSIHDSSGGAYEEETSPSRSRASSGSAVCVNCESCFPSEEELRTHMLVAHSDRRYVCKVCSYAFKQRAHLKTHMEVLHEKKRYTCEMCQAAFTTSGTLKRHIASVHEKRRESSCPHCAMNFTQKSDMRRHIQTVHEKSRPYCCGECEMRFSQVWDLKRHLRAVHTVRKAAEEDGAPAKRSRLAPARG